MAEQTLPHRAAMFFDLPRGLVIVSGEMDR
jgi:hypothetical protein